MDYEEQFDEWWEKYDDYENPDVIKFKDLKGKPYESKQICAIMFLYNKLKPEEKEQEYSFFHGEHDKMYIGSGFDMFEEFTEEEVKLAITYGISLADEGEGFEIYASM